MDAGKYRGYIVIEKNSQVSDEIGNQSSQWIEYYKGYAYVNNLSGSEYWAAAQTQSQNSVVFSLRWHKLLDAVTTKEYRLIFKDKVYDIFAVDNVQYKNETIKIKATLKE